MTSIILKNVSHAVHRALQARAAIHDHSTEAEMRLILKNAVLPDERVKLGSLLHKIGRRSAGVELDIQRDKTPTKPISFE